MVWRVFLHISHHRHQRGISEPFYPKEHHSGSYFRLSHPSNLIFTGIWWSLRSPVVLGGAQLNPTSNHIGQILQESTFFDDARKCPFSLPIPPHAATEHGAKNYVKYYKISQFWSAMGGRSTWCKSPQFPLIAKEQDQFTPAGVNAPLYLLPVFVRLHSPSINIDKSQIHNKSKWALGPRRGTETCFYLILDSNAMDQSCS